MGATPPGVTRRRHAQRPVRSPDRPVTAHAGARRRRTPTPDCLLALTPGVSGMGSTRQLRTASRRPNVSSSKPGPSRTRPNRRSRAAGPLVWRPPMWRMLKSFAHADRSASLLSATGGVSTGHVQRKVVIGPAPKQHPTRPAAPGETPKAVLEPKPPTRAPTSSGA